MKAAIISGANKIKIEEIPKPKIGPYDVLSKVKRAGICGTDYAIFSGKTFLIDEKLLEYPAICGHEWSGIVEEVGEEVRKFKVGDKVTGDDNVSCKNCIECKRGNYHLCKSMKAVGTIGNYPGAFAEYIKMPEADTYKIPENISLDMGALVEPASIAGYTVEKACIEMGDIVLINGTGSIGIFAAQFAKIAGASKTILTGRKDSKLAIGKKVGADIIVNVNTDDASKIVAKETNNNGVDVVIEASGSLSAFSDSFDNLRSGGTISIVSFFEKKLPEFDLDKMVFKEIKIVTALGCPNFFPKTLKLMDAKRIVGEPIITHKFPFEEIEKAIMAFKDQNMTRIKIILDF